MMTPDPSPIDGLQSGSCEDRMLSKIAVRSDVLRPTGMPTTDEDDDDIDMREDETQSVLDSCRAVRPGVLRPAGTPATEGSQCN